RQMSMLVASEDSSYMPARVVVLGGDSPATIRTELNAVTVLPSDSRVILLENMTRFWPVIQIRVKRCQQGGIDTRVRGIEVLGPKPTFWPIFKEQLCRRTFLSCTARAHAWCQEICQDRGQLLQLFGRASPAQVPCALPGPFMPCPRLRHPALSLVGLADPHGISPLAWLLSEYLESMEPPRHATSRCAVFGSRVRRLTQLLVHVDPEGPEPEEARAAGLSLGRREGGEGPGRGEAAGVVEKSSSLWGISQCWRGVVQQQVELEGPSMGAGGGAWDPTPGRYRGERGLAVPWERGEGAGLTVPLQVSEQFARYLDGQIQELHGAVGSTGLLQRILEPFIVFSGLEFAHTFEHFYRHYLGDRLLTQGPSWLEGAIVEQIGLCFPSRFPQEMLSNLAESEELQKQFYLFQLQEQDKRLLELD
ncbi:Cullin-9, partial [Egretta garzetta]